MSLSKNIHLLDGRPVAITEISRACFFGFYDICPWSHTQNKAVLLSVAPEFLKMPTTENASVCVWDISSNVLHQIGETTGWNWQHGARQQWMQDETVIFNDVIDGNQCSIVVDLNGTEHAKYDMSVSCLHPNNKYGISVNYARLATSYSTYGYASARNSWIGKSANEDGLWIVDLTSRKVSLMLSYEAICERTGIVYSDSMFVTHPDYSKSGNKLSFFLIEETGAGTSVMRLMVYDFVMDHLTIVTHEKSSHSTWIDDENIWCWARESSAVRMLSRSGLFKMPGVSIIAKYARKFQSRTRNTLLGEGFYIYNLKSGRKVRIAQDQLNEDGHFSLHPSREILVGDTYPDSDGFLNLFIFSLKTQRRINIARVFHDVKTPEIALRCDLHPRWSRCGNEICFDFCENGVRRTAILNVSNAISRIES